MSRTDDQRLGDILARIDAIKVAEELLVAAEVAVDEPLARTAFDAILYDLLVIGEAVKALSNDARSTHPEIPWSEIAKLRDLLAHSYFKIRSEVIRATIDAPLSELRGTCQAEIDRK